MPCAIVTNSTRIHPAAAVVDGEVKGDHAVATGPVRFGEGWGCGAGGIGGAVPGILVTSRLGFYACVAVVDDEVQNNHTVAACGVLLSVNRRVGIRSVGGAMPGEAVAGGLIFNKNTAMVYGEIQSIHIAAQRPGLTMVEGVYPALSVNIPIPMIIVTSIDMVSIIIM